MTVTPRGKQNTEKHLKIFTSRQLTDFLCRYLTLKRTTHLNTPCRGSQESNIRSSILGSICLPFERFCRSVFIEQHSKAALYLNFNDLGKHTRVSFEERNHFTAPSVAQFAPQNSVFLVLP